MKILLRIWRAMPLWVHFFAAKLVRPRFRAAVAALVFDEQGRILLFKHTYRKFEWGIPAGGLEHREQPADAIVREFHEETGVQIEIERLLTAVSAREDHHISMVYLCRIVSGEFKESLEISEMKYFPVDEMPAMMLTTEKELIKWVVKEVRR
jgi:8-oxo-dGTP diphosphatase